MRSSSNISDSARLNYYLNIVNIMPFVVVIFTGLMLQIEYHLQHLPDDHIVSGLNKSSWSLAHKVSAIISLAGIMSHCILHRKYIIVSLKNIFHQRFRTRIKLSLFLFVVYIPTSITAIGSWFFWDPENAARFSLVEIHDKLAVLLIIISIVHIISRFGWMIRTFQKLLKVKAE